MHAIVEREIARMVSDRMGHHPVSISTIVNRRRIGDDETTILRMSHRFLEGTAYDSPGMPDAVDGERLTPYGRKRVSDAIDDIARRRTREETRVRIEQSADIGRPWLEDRDPPSWTLISHPVMVHALMRAGCNDLPVVTSSNASPGVEGVSVRRLQDLLVGSCPLDPSNPSRGRVFCDDMGMVMEIADAIPHVARTALLGHPLGALIDLPACGDAELDAAVGSLFIVDIADTSFQDQPGIAVTLSPATWRACAPAPPRVNDQAMRLPHKIC